MQPVLEQAAAIAAVAANLAFALLALMRAPRRPVYRVFALACLAIAVWQWLSLRHRMTGDPWWLAAALGAALLLPGILFHLVALLTAGEEPPRRAEVGLVYAACAAAALPGLTWPLVPPSHSWLVNRSWDAVFLLVAAPILAVSIARLRVAAKRERSRGGRGLLRYVFWGTVIGAVTALLDPARKLGAPLPPLSSLGALAFSALFAWGVARHGGSHDIVRQLERAEARMREELERSRRLAALGAMLAAVAHEIRNPLASIKGSAQLLDARTRGDASLAGPVRTIVEEVDRLSDVLDRFRDFVRPLRPEREPVDLAALVRRTSEFMGMDGVAVDVDDGSKGRLADADPALVRQVLMNLLRNAREAGAGRVVARVRPAPGGVAVEVEDTGPGIPADLRERVFEPFFTTKSTGSGLGLAIARRIAEAHGGTLRAEGEGRSRLVLTLPCAARS